MVESVRDFLRGREKGESKDDGGCVCFGWEEWKEEEGLFENPREG